MRLLKELVVDVVGTVLTIYDDLASPVRGVTVAVAVSSDDRLFIRSGATGVEVTEFAGQLSVDGGRVVHFGGPVLGPLVSIDWQGTLSAKQAVFRFFDEPFAPFGDVNVRIISELAVPATSDSATYTVPNVGSWARSGSLYWTGDQAFDARVLFAVGNVQPTVETAAGTSVANELGSFQLSVWWDQMSMTFRNTGAAPSDLTATLRARLGA